MPAAAYYRQWRASHPEYRARQNELRRARRARMTPEQRRRDRGVPRPTEPPTPIPPLHTGHEIFEHAKRIAGNPGGYRYLAHPYYDDLVAEIVLALVEGRSPLDAKWAFLHAEYQWRCEALQVCEGLEAFGGHLIRQSDSH